MSDLSEVLALARSKAASDWGSGDPDNLEGCGAHCASIAIQMAVFEVGADADVNAQAHRLFLRAVNTVPAADLDAMYEQVYAFNDAQSSAAPVVGGFDRALGMVDADPTPHADALVDVLGACSDCAEVVARYIVSEFPGMDLVETQTVVSAELFYAAQDTARVYELASYAEEGDA